jgi:hypothetical protein
MSCLRVVSMNPGTSLKPVTPVFMIDVSPYSPSQESTGAHFSLTHLSEAVISHPGSEIVVH